MLLTISFRVKASTTQNKRLMISLFRNNGKMSEFTPFQTEFVIFHIID